VKEHRESLYKYFTIFYWIFKIGKDIKLVGQALATSFDQD
jgi:hypothetical protein